MKDLGLGFRLWGSFRLRASGFGALDLRVQSSRGSLQSFLATFRFETLGFEDTCCDTAQLSGKGMSPTLLSPAPAKCKEKECRPSSIRQSWPRQIPHVPEYAYVSLYVLIGSNTYLYVLMYTTV